MARTRVLLVEDSVQWREFVRHLLCEESVIDIVGEISDGLKAVRVAEQLQPDIILLDIGLPGLNGIEACGWIRRVAPEARVVFLTHLCDGHIAQAAMNRGAWGCVLKSEATQDLVPAIRSVSAGLRFVSNRLAVADDVDPEQCP